MTIDKPTGALREMRHDIPVVLCTGYSKKKSDESAAKIRIDIIFYTQTMCSNIERQHFLTLLILQLMLKDMDQISVTEYRKIESAYVNHSETDKAVIKNDM